jgi:Holliday junction resolvase RusA-like endonuclease
VIEIKIKPLSVNEVWRGRRFKTTAYSRYERDLMLILPSVAIPDGTLQIELIFGLSSKSGDGDNPVKPFIDVLQKKYGFNDNRFKRYVIEVENVKKGHEFIKFRIAAI